MTMPITPIPLTVTTEGEGKASLALYADAIMVRPPPYGDVFDLLGMSIIGPEQAIRAVAAGCAINDKDRRVVLRFQSGRGRIIRARWSWAWRVVQAVELVEGAMHMVAIAEESPLSRKERVIGHETLIIPPGDGDEDLESAIYDVLMEKYSTPIIPCDRPGQADWEQRAGLAWRKGITHAIVSDTDLWRPVLPHPEQPDRRWLRAAVLRLTDAALDTVISKLVKRKAITIPNPPERAKGAA